MNTEKWDLMAKYFVQECSDKERAELMSWVNENIENEILFFETQKNWEILNFKNNMKEVNVDSAWEKLKDRIEKDQRQQVNLVKTKVFHMSSFMKYAALGLLLIGLGIVTSKIYKSINSHSLIEYYADNNSLSEVVLNDGTKVTLYSNSKIIYPKEFNSNVRSVKLEGEAFFDVTKNPDKPFVIEVQNTEVKVLGTSFNINANLPDNKVEVFVETGMVQVTRKNGKEESAIILPGDIATVTRNSLKQNKNNDENIISWKTKQILFKEESLENVIIVLNKVYKANITCNDSELLNLRLNSTFRNQELKSVLSVISLALDVKIVEQNNEIAIVKNSV